MCSFLLNNLFNILSMSNYTFDSYLGCENEENGLVCEAFTNNHQVFASSTIVNTNMKDKEVLRSDGRQAWVVPL